MPGLRVLAADARTLAPTDRQLRPDLALLRHAPRRLHWRTPCAEIARGLGLFYAAGGQPGLGNLVAVSHRLRVCDRWYVRYPLAPGRVMRGAVLVRLAVAGAVFLVAVTEVGGAADLALLAQVLSEVDDPVIVAGVVVINDLVPVGGAAASGHPCPGLAVDRRLAVGAVEAVAGGVLALVDVPC